MFTKLQIEDIKRGYNTFVSHPQYTKLCAEAAKHGFRPATLSERMALASEDLFSWRGGVWLRENEPI